MKTEAGLILAEQGTALRRIAELALIDEGNTLPNYNIDDQSVGISIPKAGRIIVELWDITALINVKNQYYIQLNTLLKKERK